MAAPANTNHCFVWGLCATAAHRAMYTLGPAVFAICCRACTSMAFRFRADRAQLCGTVVCVSEHYMVWCCVDKTGRKRDRTGICSGIDGIEVCMHTVLDGHVGYRELAHTAVCCVLTSHLPVGCMTLSGLIEHAIRAPGPILHDFMP